MTARTRFLTPGTVSPERPVPKSITRPEYVGRADADEGRGNNFYDPEEIESVRAAGRIAANALAAVGEMIVPGITTDDIDAVAHEFMCDHGAYPSTLGYRGFPKSVCTSVNEVICHGIPDSTVIDDGDIVNVDITAYYRGMHGDTNYTFTAGETDEDSRLLIERTYEAMMRGIKAVKPGREINIVGRVIEKYAKRFGYGVVRDYSGHGVGREFHSGLIVPHYDAAPAHAETIAPGMIFTVEPMLNLGTIDWDVWDDAWTVVTKDRRRSAQFEHTLVVTDTGAEILTRPDADTAIAGGPVGIGGLS